MSKYIYEILNNITMDIEELNKDGFDNIEKEKIKSSFIKSINRTKNKNRKKSIIAAALVCAITIGMLESGFGSSVVAAIKLASVDIAFFLGINKDLDLYKTVVGQTESSDGVNIQLNEVVLNGNELVVSTTTKYEKRDFEIESIHPFGEVFINGRKISESSGGIGKVSEDSTFQEVMTYSLKNNQLKGDLNIKIVYSSILMNGEVIKIKPCIFEFITNGDELALDTIELPINHSFTLENGSIVTLNNYVSNAIDKSIFLTIENINKSKVVYDIQLKGYDDRGNELFFQTRNMSTEQGMLKLSTVAGQEISDEATEITLIPYAVGYPQESGKFNNDHIQVGEKFTIKIK